MKLFVEDPNVGLTQVELNNYQRHIMGQEVPIDGASIISKATEMAFRIELEQMQKMRPVGESENTFTRSFTFPRQQGISTGLIFKAIELAINGDDVLFVSLNHNAKINNHHKCQTILDNNNIQCDIDRSVITFENRSKISFGTTTYLQITEKIIGDPVVIVDLFDFMKDSQKDIIINELAHLRKMLISTRDIDTYMISNFNYHKEGETH